MIDTRPEYPEEFDQPEWECDTLKSIAEQYGIHPAADCLRAIDKYGDGETVSIRLPNGEKYFVPDDLSKIRALSEDEPVEAWIVHGIAWDGTDWEHAEEVSSCAKLPDAIKNFHDALDEHRFDLSNEEN